MPLLATHFFVFYYGVLADVTPPVALAAYAAAGIAGSEPMRTGLTAFRLSMGKALVPFMFVYTPALLFIGFTWGAFLIALVSTIVAIMGLGAAYTGQLKRPIGALAFIALNALSISLVFAQPFVSAIGVAGVLTILLWHARATAAPLPRQPAPWRTVQRGQTSIDHRGHAAYRGAHCNAIRRPRFEGHPQAARYRRDCGRDCRRADGHCLTPAQQRVFFGIATGGTGGTYYPLGGMLAQLISNKVTIGGKKLSATAETAGASVANAQLLGRKDIESAFVAADILDSAYKGTGQFDGKPLKNLRALGALYPEQVQLVTLASANIKGFKDLKGKSVSSGSPGSGQWQLLGDLLETYGMTRKDIGEDLSSFAQSVDKIKDGNLHRSLITAGAPTRRSSTWPTRARSASFRWRARDRALRKKQPYYAKVQLPANTYKGQSAPVDTLAVMAIWATHDGVTDRWPTR